MSPTNSFSLGRVGEFPKSRIGQGGWAVWVVSDCDWKTQP